jgi:hypothetical protein
MKAAISTLLTMACSAVSTLLATARSWQGEDPLAHVTWTHEGEEFDAAERR